MKVSIFTPTHNVEHLKRLAVSLDNQTFKDFEWVIIPNKKVTYNEICDQLESTDVRYEKTRVSTSGRAQESNSIGELKKIACESCRGEILVEVDHDDELFPTALEEIVAAFHQNLDVDFVYSNCCRVNPDGTGHVFGQEWGWASSLVRDASGKIYAETRSFAPSPAAFSKIWYAPDHVRAWRKSFYDKIGGHNPELDVLDDHDLLCRTYIAGNVKHIDKALYIYHIHPNNTCYGAVYDKIQEKTLEIHDQYIYPMVEKWCDINGLRKIDLCGGISKPAGYESIDLRGGDISFNLNNRDWPFKPGEVGLFRAHDSLEHLNDPINTMQEIYRCLAPHGWLLSFTPSTDGRGAFQDPTHVSFWNSNSFWYYTKKQQNSYINCPVRFQLNRIRNYFPSPWHRLHNILYVQADLLKLDPEIRTPGLIEI
jgi:glycosyltransferase involved in cell wall biosynthesis